MGWDGNVEGKVIYSILIKIIYVYFQVRLSVGPPQCQTVEIAGSSVVIPADFPSYSTESYLSVTNASIEDHSRGEQSPLLTCMPSKKILSK